MIAPRSLLFAFAVLSFLATTAVSFFRSSQTWVSQPRLPCLVFAEKAGQGVACVAPATGNQNTATWNNEARPILNPTRRHALGIQIDVNQASFEELVALPKIGPAMARKIIASRPHKTCAELIGITGMGSATLRRIQDWLALCNDPTSGYSK